MFEQNHAVFPSLQSYNLRNSRVDLKNKIIIYIGSLIAKSRGEMKFVIINNRKKSICKGSIMPDLNVIKFDVQVVLFRLFDLAHQKNYLL
jgi:carbon monoxide dehydrogenase subunit G